MCIRCKPCRELVGQIGPVQSSAWQRSSLQDHQGAFSLSFCPHAPLVGVALLFCISRDNRKVLESKPVARGYP